MSCKNKGKNKQTKKQQAWVWQREINKNSKIQMKQIK
jgi:hypothetical protein